MWPTFSVRNNQESGSFEKKNFICVDNVCKVGETAFQLLDVGNEHVDDR